jgi:uncharacterized cupredoxin-like copper-binding protein
MSLRLMAPLTAAALCLTVASCGGNDNESDRDPGTAATPAATKTPSAQAGATASGGRLAVSMADFKFVPATVTADAGKLRVTAKNDGRVEHEFVLLRTDASPDSIPLEGNAASESDSVGEIAEQQPGETGTHTFTVKPGKYVFICNVDGHYKLGMRGSLTVE